MKLFMHWDMEGVSGLFRREQAWYWDEGAPPEAGEEGRALLMADINSAAAAALDAGADELIICDTHRGGGNIVLDRMLRDSRITYLERSRGLQDGRLRWMPGLDETVDGFLLPGHHAMAGTPNAFLPHTWNLDWADFRINGRSVGEMGIEACFAGHWGIPVVLAQGDEAACAEAEGLFPGVLTAGVKRAVGHDQCTGPEPATARELMAERIREAVAAVRSRQCRPFQPALPMTLSLRLTSVEAADAAARKPGLERLDDLTVEAIAHRHCDVVWWITETGLDAPSA